MNTETSPIEQPIENRESVISVKDLSKVYKLYPNNKARFKEALFKKKYHQDFYALEDVTFDIKEGECFGIIGKNGSGKSTLLKILTGVLNKSSGDVDIKGRIAALLELGAGFNPEYTGRENIYLNGQIMGYTKEEIDKKVDDIIEFASIGDHIDQPVKTYSSGMFVRLAFAISINVDPEILIVDEALSVGDAFFQLKCYKKFTELKKAGKTIVFVTHDLSSVMKYCDRVIVLNEGHLIDEGKANEMVDLYKQILVDEEMLKGSKESQELIEDAEIVEDDENPKSKEKTVKSSGKLKSNVKLNEKILEYGTKQAEIIELEVLDEKGRPAPKIEKFDKLVVKFKVRFNEEIKDPIFALTIKDIKGTEITGTNTMFEGIEGFTGKPGEVYEAVFEQELPLQSGSYFLSLGCTGLDYQGNFSVFHRFYDVAQVDVLSSKNDTVGFFDTHSKVDVKKLENNG